jgi:hypothetical protein
MSKQQAATPQLGKRKRGASNALPDADDGEEDELSPNRDEDVRSIEKSRRVVGTVSPIREEIDEAPDELSLLEDGGSTARKIAIDASAALNGIPVSVLARKRLSSASVQTNTPIVDKSGSAKVTSRSPKPRRSKSTELSPATPGMTPTGRPTTATNAGTHVEISEVQDESEDELSPQISASTPRIVATEDYSIVNDREDDAGDVDELSSPIQPTPVQQTPAAQKAARAGKDKAHQAEGQIAVEPKKRGRPRRVVLDEEEEASSALVPAKTAKRGRPAKSAQTKEAQVTSTPIVPKPRRRQRETDEDVEEDDQLDELSPDKERTTEPTNRHAKRARDEMDVDGAESDVHEHEPTPRPTTKRPSPQRKQQIKPTTEKPRRRHKFLGPKHAISVMRIKGSAVRGITVADTTRTILEETIDHRLNRMVEKMQTSQDSAQRKDLRSEINMSLSFKESLNEKLLDLQDANDILNTNFKKMKLFKRDNAELRKDILALQHSRQEVALEHDDVQAEYDAEKAKVDAKNKLSEDMFDIEAAIQNGREKARKESREDEGPVMPLSMLLGIVGRDVGSFGGGLLSNVKNFNGALERAAGWLEGRA